METIDAAVIGAGVVGLAVARALALAGREVIVLEQAEAIGTGISSRNSEVIHAGIYYPRGSLKAQLCVAGRALLYRYCEEHGVAHRRCGKLIVATNETEAAELAAIREAGLANGVGDLAPLSRDEVRAMEPELRCVAALHSPSTGIIDSHALMLALLGDAENRGAMLALKSPMLSARVVAGGTELDIGGDEPTTVLARSLVNCAGLHAQATARRITGLDARHVPGDWYARGNYFSLAARSPCTRLVYPVPEPGGLGVHLTLDLAGQARFGPDVEWLPGLHGENRADSARDYAVDPARGEKFYAAIRRYWPGLPDDALQPAYAGIRPKISGPGESARDFVISGPREHGVPGLVNLFGIESPGLTSSLAIANVVADLLET
jgi:L-2-hydroxyglutarate oxidase LhgO